MRAHPAAYPTRRHGAAAAAPPPPQAILFRLSAPALLAFDCPCGGAPRFEPVDGPAVVVDEVGRRGLGALNAVRPPDKWGEIAIALAGLVLAGGVAAAALRVPSVPVPLAAAALPLLAALFLRVVYRRAQLGRYRSALAHVAERAEGEWYVHAHAACAPCGRGFASLLRREELFVEYVPVTLSSSIQAVTGGLKQVAAAVGSAFAAAANAPPPAARAAPRTAQHASAAARAGGAGRVTVAGHPTSARGGAVATGRPVATRV